MEDKIAACALDHYDNVLPLNKGKPKDSEWTVYAAIVAVDQEDDQRCWVVSCATGTKCSSFVPPSTEMAKAEQEQLETTILRDCHAEALTRRGLMQVLWKEIHSHQKDPTEFQAQKERLLDIIPETTSQFQLRSNITLHYYISDPPCGDASIFPLNQVHAQSTAQKSQVNHEINFTGAKVIVNSRSGVQAQECSQQLVLGSPTDATTVAREQIQLLGRLRTKSGRSNLPDHMRSSCMSCSDKLVRWCVLGLQGALLSNYIPSGIRPTSLVVSQDLRALDRSAQHAAMARATTERVVSTIAYLRQTESSAFLYCKPVLDWKGPKVSVVDRGFDRGKSRVEFNEQQAILSQQRQQPKADKSNEPPPSKRRKRDNSSSPCGISLNWNQSAQGTVEQIVGARGICQGKKPKTPVHYRELSSRLSRYSLAGQAQIAMNETEKPSSYKEWKQSKAEESYQKLRTVIFEGGPLAGWLAS